jgi:hypothetical protein
MQSDPWWSFAMAVNVYMVFFMAYQPRYKHMWLYCLLCFGLPSLPALVCLFYAPGGRPIYGNATVGWPRDWLLHPGSVILCANMMVDMVLDCG